MIFNVPSAIIMLIFQFKPGLIPWPAYHYLIALVFIFVIPLNAACNPILYFWRMERLREQSIKTFRNSIIGRKALNSVRGLKEEPVTMHSYMMGGQHSREQLNASTL